VYFGEVVEAGYATITVDRPGDGRRPFHLDTTRWQWPFALDNEAAWDEFSPNPELFLQTPTTAAFNAGDDLHPDIRLRSLGRSYERC
jgi:hypothetical protein